EAAVNPRRVAGCAAGDGADDVERGRIGGCLVLESTAAPGLLRCVDYLAEERALLDRGCLAAATAGRQESCQPYCPAHGEDAAAAAPHRGYLRPVILHGASPSAPETGSLAASNQDPLRSEPLAVQASTSRRVSSGTCPAPSAGQANTEPSCQVQRRVRPL